MKGLLFCTLFTAVLCAIEGVHVPSALSITEGLSQTWRTEGRKRRDVDELCDTCDLQTVTHQLARQIDLQRLFIEERIRSDGSSGIKQTRLVKKGSKTYHSTSFTGPRIAAIHEHSNNVRTVGLGEFEAVLNGVEFRTRHNDYPLMAPSMTDSGYEVTEEIPYPDVPEAVTSLENVEDQIVEMREWFKAWRDQDDSVRDYKPYFKPLLCYLEGAWIIPDGDTLEEGFESDRHTTDASTWYDLQNKVKFTSYTGKKDREENYSFLPTTIVKARMNNSLTVTTAQWNYRILCHQLSSDLPTNRLRLIDDLQSRMGWLRTMEEHEMSRAARFQVNPTDSDVWTEKIKLYQLIDKLMEQIPGKDNYMGNLPDTALGDNVKKFGTEQTINAAFYHGWFTGGVDAMGSPNQHRGFSDESLYMARTSQQKVAPMSVEKCVKSGGSETCTTYTQRWSYAIPLEIIYTTPLYKWNPYGLQYKGWSKSELGLTVTAGGTRNGEASLDKAFDGTNSQWFYQTPAEFFMDDNGSGDSADTAAGVVSVLDPAGEMHSVVASGTRILLPNIQDVGVLRTRYPIMPIHAEGSAVWKEVDALKELMLNPNTYEHMFPPSDYKRPEPEVQVLKTGPAINNDKTHSHHVILLKEQAMQLTAGPEFNVTVRTSTSDGHFHEMVVSRGIGGNFRYLSCDGIWRCNGGHLRRLYCTGPPQDKCIM